MTEDAGSIYYLRFKADLGKMQPGGRMQPHERFHVAKKVIMEASTIKNQAKTVSNILQPLSNLYFETGQCCDLCDNEVYLYIKL